MTSFEYIKSLPRHWLPPKGASNSQIFRWLNSGSVIINGERPHPHDKIDFPIKELVFFPSGRTRTYAKSIT